MARRPPPGPPPGSPPGSPPEAELAKSFTFCTRKQWYFSHQKLPNSREKRPEKCLVPSAEMMPYKLFSPAAKISALQFISLRQAATAMYRER